MPSTDKERKEPFFLTRASLTHSHFFTCINVLKTPPFSFISSFGWEPLIKKRFLTHLYSIHCSALYPPLTIAWRSAELSVLAHLPTGIFPQHVLQLLWVISMVICDFHADSWSSQTMHLTSVPLANVSVWLSIIFHAGKLRSQPFQARSQSPFWCSLHVSLRHLFVICVRFASWN